MNIESQDRVLFATTFHARDLCLQLVLRHVLPLLRRNAMITSRLRSPIFFRRPLTLLLLLLLVRLIALPLLLLLLR